MRHPRLPVMLALLAPIFGCSDSATEPHPAIAFDTADRTRTVCSDVKSTQVLVDNQWVPAFIFDFTNFSYPGAYPAPLDGSQWIGPTATASFDAAPGVYHFRTTFKLPADGTRILGTSLTGQIHADNSATVILNGSPIFQHETVGEPVNYSDPAQTFSATGGFTRGINTLDFDLWNDPYDGLNPTSLDFCYTVTTP
jgi:hypothetical protein